MFKNVYCKEKVFENLDCFFFREMGWRVGEAWGGLKNEYYNKKRKIKQKPRLPNQWPYLFFTINMYYTVDTGIS